MILIAVLAYFMTQNQDDNSINSSIPVLGALALGAQRLLPVMQQGYGSYSAIKGSWASLEDVISLLDQQIPSYAGKPFPHPIDFKESIRLELLGYKYSTEEPWIFRDIELTIKKGSRIGFIGQTGSGKSTIFDVIMGLIYPTEGQMKIDNQVITQENVRSWQARIAHVPQDIYLSDNSISENIAFGIPYEDIDLERVIEVAKRAQIDELIESWEEKYNTFVGEHGIRLSGGQRQRIGIARALYKDADVLIFDEATSALDNETEKSVVKSIEALEGDLTILMIAHRISTLKNCDQIIELVDKNIKVRTYEDSLRKKT